MVFSCSAVRTYSVRPCDASCCLFWCAFTYKHDYSGKFMWGVRGRKSLWFTLTYLLTKILKSVKSSFQNVFVCSIGTLIFLNRSELFKNGSKCLRSGLINWEMTEMRFNLLKYALTESFATTAEAETNLNIFRKSRDDTVSIGSKKLKMLQFSQGRASKDQNQIMLGIQHLRTDSDRTVSRSRVSMTIKTATVIFVLTSCWCFHDGDSSRCSCDHLQRP